MRTKREPLTDAGGNVRELTKDDFEHMVPIDQLPEPHRSALQRALRHRGPQKAPTKQQVTLRLSPEVLEHYKADGPGWQTRLDRTLVNVVQAAKARRQAAPRKKTASKKTALVRRRTKAV